MSNASDRDRKAAAMPGSQYDAQQQARHLAARLRQATPAAPGRWSHHDHAFHDQLQKLAQTNPKVTSLSAGLQQAAQQLIQHSRSLHRVDNNPEWRAHAVSKLHYLQGRQLIQASLSARDVAIVVKRVQSALSGAHAVLRDMVALAFVR